MFTPERQLYRLLVTLYAQIRISFCESSVMGNWLEDMTDQFQENVQDLADNVREEH
ncbi:MAG TPA: hypothetical protein VFQ43_21390 [Nitrososphaera sp.]|nr:hypothetical protein [Nitrososphaera sp.]